MKFIEKLKNIPLFWNVSAGLTKSKDSFNTHMADWKNRDDMFLGVFDIGYMVRAFFLGLLSFPINLTFDIIEMPWYSAKAIIHTGNKIAATVIAMGIQAVTVPVLFVLAIPTLIALAVWDVLKGAGKALKKAWGSLFPGKAETINDISISRLDTNNIALNHDDTDADIYERRDGKSAVIIKRSAKNISGSDVSKTNEPPKNSEQIHEKLGNTHKRP